MVGNVKRKLNYYPHYSTPELIKKIKDYRYISFDFFDTLIKRDVGTPENLFQTIEKIYNTKYNTKINNFSILRFDAERKLRRNNPGTEIVIEEIYEEIGKECPKLSKEVLDELLRIELSCEKNGCCINYEIYQVYRWCVENNKHVLIISDTSLRRQTILEICENNDINLQNTAVYLSSEEKKMKKTGELFSTVLAKEGIKTKDLIHIGDNKLADFLAPRKIGIRSINICKYHTECQYLEISDGRITGYREIISSIINNRLPIVEGELEKLGYEVYGPLLFGFATWLVQNLDSNKSILFFSRDGYVIKKACEILLNQDNFGIYFLASRRSLLLPALHCDSSISNFKELMRSESARLSVSEIFDKLGLPEDQFRDVVEKSGLTYSTIINRDELDKNDKFVTLYNKIMHSDIQVKASKAYTNFTKYWSSLKLTSDIQVVDIGWRCTMQNCLQKVIGVPMHGYYFGIKNDSFIKDANKATGLYWKGENDNGKNCMIASMTALYEIFFTAPMASVIGYSENGNPVFGKYEREDDPYGEEVICKLQDGALRFVKDMRTNIYFGILSSEKAINNYLVEGINAFGTKPHNGDLQLLSSIHFGTGTKNDYLAKPKRISYYLRKPRVFIRDFANAGWKIGFLRELFKIKLPYYSMFSYVWDRYNQRKTKDY